MSTCTNKKIQLPKSRRIDEETLLMQKQGIVTILGSNNDSATSLRRTLSADMSSKKWLSQNGFSPIKKISSSEEISRSFTEPTVADSSSSSEDDNSEEIKQNRCQIWEIIQKEENVDKSREFDIWSSVLSKKANEESSKVIIPAYVHPLVRRSKSCLSEKSLQICTESLGSETGSDGFSSYSPSETEDSEEEKEEKEEKEKVELSHEEEFHVPKQNHAVKRTSPRSFPPPLPSLHMRSHRDNGRLFIQAVSVPSQNNFSAERQNGRLVLTFAEMSEVEEEEFEEGDDEAEESESCVKEQEHAPMLLSSGIGLALMMNKPSGVGDSNRNPKWSEKFKFNDVVNFKDVDVAQHSPLPPRPRARIVPSSLSAYEYYCKTKPTPKPSPTTFTFHHHNNYSSLENNFKSCKDSRRSFLFWEPYCIAT
ncbi:protein FAF-like, chloroplastic [Vigna unguiculata]|uniref:The fantastic four family n=1 Tax=Vigna unguiculata TaxID=3917 RepID=A0A4D6N6R9_VIGUN|nr:protein FAF-like, chloroplastic [Vigna unguiculata]QCE09513.1 The fantastic four family [Vigna unguiculata]